MIAPNFSAIPDFLTNIPRWVGWKTELRGGKPTKVPKTLDNKNAASSRSDTWTSFNVIAAALQHQPDWFDGPGLMLGRIGDDEHLCGVDLDSSLDHDGTLAAWAEPYVAALPTYGEVSPSGTGLKFFFRASVADADQARAAFGFAHDAWGCRRAVGLNGADHGPAIEIYLGPGRFFTVTGCPWPPTPEEVALFDRTALLRLAALVSQPATGNHRVGQRGHDDSRSATAFRLAKRLRQQGCNFDDMVKALFADPETAAWVAEKGQAANNRELIRLWARTAPDEVRPAIRVVAGKRHEAADAGLAALDTAGEPFFVRDRSLVRVCATKAKASDGSVVMVPTVVPVTPAALGRALGQATQWERVSRKGEIIQIDPPAEVVAQIADMVGEWPFPPLFGVIGTATMRPDGSLLLTEGYDPATGFVLFSPPPMPAMPAAPTKRDALDALSILHELLQEFPFANEASRSVAMSMLMTPVLRGALTPAVPLHVITAPEAGTGKSYLQDIASVIATGDRCAVLSMSGAEETEKRLIGAALTQLPIIAIDNISDLLLGDFLCQASERPVLLLRPLGTSNLVRIPNSFTIFANGNNLRVGADVVRRTIQCALDAQVENPETRAFGADPVAMVLADRGKYIAACLTIARAYIVAGRPSLAPRYASYGGWSDIVRSALIWLNWPDPVETIVNVQAEDPIRQQRAAVFSAWSQELQVNVGYQTSELIGLAEQYHHSTRAYPALWDALYAVAAPRSGFAQIDPKKLGKWLGGNVGTIASGHRLTVDRTDNARPRWIVSPQ